VPPRARRRSPAPQPAAPWPRLPLAAPRAEPARVALVLSDRVAPGSSGQVRGERCREVTSARGSRAGTAGFCPALRGGKRATSSRAAPGSVGSSVSVGDIPGLGPALPQPRASGLRGSSAAPSAPHFPAPTEAPRAERTRDPETPNALQGFSGTGRSPPGCWGAGGPGTRVLGGVSSQLMPPSSAVRPPAPGTSATSITSASATPGSERSCQTGQEGFAAGAALPQPGEGISAARRIRVGCAVGPVARGRRALRRAFPEHPMLLAATLAGRHKGCDRWPPSLGRGGEESRLGDIVLVTKAQCSLRRGAGFPPTNTKFPAATGAPASGVRRVAGPGCTEAPRSLGQKVAASRRGRVPGARPRLCHPFLRRSSADPRPTCSHRAWFSDGGEEKPHSGAGGRREERARQQPLGERREDPGRAVSAPHVSLCSPSPARFMDGGRHQGVLPPARPAAAVGGSQVPAGAPGRRGAGGFPGACSIATPAAPPHPPARPPGKIHPPSNEPGATTRSVNPARRELGHGSGEGRFAAGLRAVLAQHPSMAGVGRALCGSPSPPSAEAGSPRAAQHHIQGAGTSPEKVGAHPDAAGSLGVGSSAQTDPPARPPARPRGEKGRAARGPGRRLNVKTLLLPSGRRVGAAKPVLYFSENSCDFASIARGGNGVGASVARPRAMGRGERGVCSNGR